MGNKNAVVDKEEAKKRYEMGRYNYIKLNKKLKKN